MNHSARKLINTFTEKDWKPIIIPEAPWSYPGKLEIIAPPVPNPKL